MALNLCLACGTAYEPSRSRARCVECGSPYWEDYDMAKITTAGGPSDAEVQAPAADEPTPAPDVAGDPAELDHKDSPGDDDEPPRRKTPKSSTKHDSTTR